MNAALLLPLVALILQAAAALAADGIRLEMGGPSRRTSGGLETFAQHRDKGEGNVGQMARAEGADGITRGQRGARKTFLDIERFGGIGLTLRADAVLEEVVIMSVTPGSPASKAGLREGQFIRSIDATPTQGKSLSKCVQAMRGEVGTKVKLEAFDPDENKARVVELTREEIMTTGMEWIPGLTNLNEWIGILTNLAVTTDQVLRLETTNGACAVIHFLGFTKDFPFGGGDGQDTATYRWRFKASPGAATISGTNTVVERYRMKVTGPNQFVSAPLNSPGHAKVKAGEIAVRWSYGNKKKGYILINLSTLKANLHDLSEFEKGP